VSARPDRAGDSEHGGEHEELHVLLGAFVLGGLDPDEHRAFTRHLRHCEVCQREAAQLSGLPTMLDLVEPSEVAVGVLPETTGDGTVVEAASVQVPRRLLQRVRADRRRRRWRLAVAAAVLAVLAGGIGAAIGPVMSRITAPPTRGLVAAAAPASGQSTPPRVEIDLVSRTWGTQLDLRGTSLPPGQVLYLAVTDKDGHSYDVASWTGTPSGRATLSAACWMKSDDIAKVNVHTDDGEALATANT
jgi:hypothetical protein